MELKLVNCKSTMSMFVETEVEKKLFSFFLNSKTQMFGLNFTPHHSSSKATIQKTYSSRSWQSSISSVSQERYTKPDSSATKINGINGSNVFTRVTRVLDAIDDMYDGIIINSERLPTNPNVFTFMLRSSLSHWKMKGKKGVWLKLPLEKSELVPIAAHEGFEYHHAEKDYVMMTYWIPEGPSHLPSNASHQVGVGGFVINHNNEVLVVQETHYTEDLAGLWKIPTGFIHESEEIFEGIVREVKEETGIETEFVEVIAFRQAHNVAFEKSDLFFVCILRPLSSKIIVDDHEIQAAKWMPLVEFINQPLIQEDSMFKKIVDICIAQLENNYCGLSVDQLVSRFDGKTSSLYFNRVEDQNSTCQAS